MGWLTALPGFARNAGARLLTRASRRQRAFGDRVAEIALGQVGVREVTRNSGPEIDEYIRAAGQDVDKDPSYCACYVYWVLEQAAEEFGIPVPCLRTGGASKQWIAAGKRGYLRIWPKDVLAGRIKLQRGDVAVWGRDARGARIIARDGKFPGHTGFVVGHVSGEVAFETAEANTVGDGEQGSQHDGQGVHHRTTRRLDDDHLVGFWRPS